MIKKEKNRIIIKIGFIKFKMSTSFSKFLIKLLKPLIPVIDMLIPKDNNKIVAHLFTKHENKIFALTDYINKNYPEYKISFIIHGGDDIPIKKNTFWIYSFKAIYELLTSKYILISQIGSFLEFYKSNKHVYLNLWHGMPIKTIGFTRPKTKNGLKHYGIIAKNFKCFATSDIFKQILISCFMVKYDNIYVTGLPITDLVLNNDKDFKVKNFLGFEKYKKAILYLPTYKTKFGDMEKQVDATYKNIFYMDDYINNDFIEFLEKNDILFIMKPHPIDEEFYYNNLDTLPNSDNFKIIFDKDLKNNNFDLYETFKYVDLMISDFSSVVIDYLILNKPVLLLDNLKEDYSNTRGMILKDNYRIFMPGLMVKTYKELEDNIIDALTVDSTRELRERTLPLLHKYRDNKASERIFEIMKNL